MGGCSVAAVVERGFSLALSSLWEGDAGDRLNFLLELGFDLWIAGFVD
jgi:hypothetical protein